MRNITAPRVNGEDFFDREHQLTQFWELIKNGHHILIAVREGLAKHH